jgi:hypothetical protein
MIALETYRLLVRLDFVLAVLLTVAVPLGLLIGGRSAPRLRARMLAYWRVSALLMIAAYALMARLPMGLWLGVVARALIPLVLFRGDGLLGDRYGPVPGNTPWHRSFRRWRGLLLLYCALGVLWTLPLLSALWQAPGSYARLWFAEVQAFRALFHSGTDARWLACFAQTGLACWTLYALAALGKGLRKRRKLRRA